MKIGGTVEKWFLEQMEDKHTSHYDTLKDQIKNELEVINVEHDSLTDHGREHSKRLIKNLGRIFEGFSIEMLNPTSIYILLCATWLHDIGYAHEDAKDLDPEEAHKRHAELSAQAIREDEKLKFLGNSHLIKVLSYVCLGHRRDKNLEKEPFCNEPTIHGDNVDIAFLAALLRLADALDTTNERASERGSDYVKRQNYNSKLHWDVCKLISDWEISNESTLRITADSDSFEERGLLEWKMDDLWNEYGSCRNTLGERGIQINRIVCNLLKKGKIERPEKVTYSEPPVCANEAIHKIDEHGGVVSNLRYKYFSQEYFEGMKRLLDEKRAAREHFRQLWNISFQSESGELKSLRFKEDGRVMKAKVEGNIEPRKNGGKHIWEIVLFGIFMIEESPKIRKEDNRIYTEEPIRVGGDTLHVEYELPEKMQDFEIDYVLDPPKAPHYLLRFWTSPQED